MTALPPHRLSIITPLYNEEDNVAPLLDRMQAALADYPMPWELIIVDDGSSDDTVARCLAGAKAIGPHIRVVALQRNFGQTAAMQAGLDAALGDVLVTLDGDLQNDPIDIPRMVARLLRDDLDLVVGWRKDRKDNLLIRKIPSRIANRLIGNITGVTLHDYGCSLKVYRGEVIRNVRLFGEMHRFIPAWMALETSPRRMAEEVVTHHARQFGESKYGISRTFRVILDLLAVYFFMRFRTRPIHFFGSIGLMSGSVGSLILLYLTFIKVFLGASIGNRPLLMLGVLLVVAGLQFLTTGVLAEMLSRTYYASKNGQAYVVRKHYAAGDATLDAAFREPTA